jgi:hypothetical protein
MKHQHQRTLQALFAHPLQHGLRCSEVEALLLHLGASVTPLSERRVQLRLPNGEETWLHRPIGPHHPHLDEDAMLRVRRLLQRSGIDPQQPLPPAVSPRGDQAVRLVLRLSHRDSEAFRLEGEQVEHWQLRPQGVWGSDQNLSHRHERDLAGQRAPIDHAYLEQLSQAIATAEAVLLVGHGHGESDLRQLLKAHLQRHHPTLLERIEEAEGGDDTALGERGLLALARQHFGNQPHRRQLLVPGQEVREPD